MKNLSEECHGDNSEVKILNILNFFVEWSRHGIASHCITSYISMSNGSLRTGVFFLIPIIAYRVKGVL